MFFYVYWLVDLFVYFLVSIIPDAFSLVRFWLSKKGQCKEFCWWIRVGINHHVRKRRGMISKFKNWCFSNKLRLELVKEQAQIVLNALNLESYVFICWLNNSCFQLGYVCLTFSKPKKFYCLAYIYMSDPYIPITRISCFDIQITNKGKQSVKQ